MDSYFDTGLVALGWIAFALAIILGLFLDLLGLFGNWLILTAIAAAWWLTGGEHFGPWWVLLVLGAVALFGEVLETAVAGYGAKKFGGSKGAMVAALVGCIAGMVLGAAIPIPIIGSLIGACIGAFVFAAGYDYIQHEKDAYSAAWIGVGAAVGKIGGLFAKLFCGIGMLIIAAFAW